MALNLSRLDFENEVCNGSVVTSRHMLRVANRYSLKLKILLIFACPMGIQQLRLQNEERAIREALRHSQNEDIDVDLSVLPACTIDDLTSHLIQNRNRYDIIHFSGHTDRLNLLLRSIIESLKFSNEQVDESSFRSVSVLKELENAVESFLSKFERQMVEKLNPQVTNTTYPQRVRSSAEIFEDLLSPIPIPISQPTTATVYPVLTLNPVEVTSGNRLSFSISNLAVTLKSGESSSIDFQKTYSYDELVDIGVGSLAFEAEGGRPVFVPTRAFADLLSRQTHTKCVVLNACSSFVQADAMRSFVPMCVYFEGKVSDVESVSFSRGFYGAVAEGLDFERCFVEGRSRMQLCGYLPGVPVRPMGPSARCIVNMFLNEILMTERMNGWTTDGTRHSFEDTNISSQGPSCVPGLGSGTAIPGGAVDRDLASENAELKSFIAMGYQFMEEKDKEIRKLQEEKAQLIARFTAFATLGAAGRLYAEASPDPPSSPLDQTTPPHVRPGKVSGGKAGSGGGEALHTTPSRSPRSGASSGRISSNGGSGSGTRLASRGSYRGHGSGSGSGSKDGAGGGIHSTATAATTGMRRPARRFGSSLSFSSSSSPSGTPAIARKSTVNSKANEVLGRLISLKQASTERVIGFGSTLTMPTTSSTELPMGGSGVRPLSGDKSAHAFSSTDRKSRLPTSASMASTSSFSLSQHSQDDLSRRSLSSSISPSRQDAQCSTPPQAKKGPRGGQEYFLGAELENADDFEDIMDLSSSPLTSSMSMSTGRLSFADVGNQTSAVFEDGDCAGDTRGDTSMEDNDAVVFTIARMTESHSSVEMKTKRDSSSDSSSGSGCSGGSLSQSASKFSDGNKVRTREVHQSFNKSSCSESSKVSDSRWKTAGNQLSSTSNTASAGAGAGAGARVGAGATPSIVALSGSASAKDITALAHTTTTSTSTTISTSANFSSTTSPMVSERMRVQVRPRSGSDSYRENNHSPASPRLSHSSPTLRNVTANRMTAARPSISRTRPLSASSAEFAFQQKKSLDYVTSPCKPTNNRSRSPVDPSVLESTVLYADSGTSLWSTASGPHKQRSSKLGPRHSLPLVGVNVSTDGVLSKADHPTMAVAGAAVGTAQFRSTSASRNRSNEGKSLRKSASNVHDIFLSPKNTLQPAAKGASGLTASSASPAGRSRGHPTLNKITRPRSAPLQSRDNVKLTKPSRISDAATSSLLIHQCFSSAASKKMPDDMPTSHATSAPISIAAVTHASGPFTTTLVDAKPGSINENQAASGRGNSGTAEECVPLLPDENGLSDVSVALEFVSLHDLDYDSASTISSLSTSSTLSSLAAEARIAQGSITAAVQGMKFHEPADGIAFAPALQAQYINTSSTELSMLISMPRDSSKPPLSPQRPPKHAHHQSAHTLSNSPFAASTTPQAQAGYDGTPEHEIMSGSCSSTTDDQSECSGPSTDTYSVRSGDDSTDAESTGTRMMMQSSCGDASVVDPDTENATAAAMNAQQYSLSHPDGGKIVTSGSQPRLSTKLCSEIPPPEDIILNLQISASQFTSRDCSNLGSELDDEGKVRNNSDDQWISASSSITSCGSVARVSFCDDVDVLELKHARPFPTVPSSKGYVSEKVRSRAKSSGSSSGSGSGSSSSSSSSSSSAGCHHIRASSSSADLVHSRNTLSDKEHTHSIVGASLSGDSDTVAAHASTPCGSITAAPKRGSSAGLREFVKQRREAARITKPSSAFASAVPRFETSPSPSVSGGGSGAVAAAAAAHQSA